MSATNADFAIRVSRISGFRKSAIVPRSRSGVFGFRFRSTVSVLI